MAEHTTKEYMIHCNNGGSVFVKEKDFFISEGGDREEWGKGWIPALAFSIEGARYLGTKMLSHARPYERQAGCDPRFLKKDL